jgi:2,5-diketo-D-gluconate reductase A
MSGVPTITLNNGVEIPQLGFGVFQIEPEETKDATLAALEVGYRHIDTAEMYGNEKQVGEAVRASGIDRGELFVTSKLNNSFHAYDDALGAFDQTMQDLDIGYLDLFLVHWPLPGVGDFVETWKAMETIYASGRVRAIGVSNFHAHHLRALIDHAEVVPTVNQVELHPYLQQDELRAVNTELGVATEAWAPLARGGELLADPVNKHLADKHGRTPAQVVLRWHVQMDTIVIPKSVTPSRIAENFDIFDFELDDEDMAAVAGLDKGRRTGAHPDEVA